MGLSRLDCAVQTYDWGKKGKDSMVARLKLSDDPNFDVDEVIAASLLVPTVFE